MILPSLLLISSSKWSKLSLNNVKALRTSPNEILEEAILSVMNNWHQLAMKCSLSFFVSMSIVFMQECIRETFISLTSRTTDYCKLWSQTAIWPLYPLRGWASTGTVLEPSWKWKVKGGTYEHFSAYEKLG